MRLGGRRRRSRGRNDHRPPDPSREPPARRYPAQPGTVDPATCGGKTFTGFDGEDLVAKRVVANAGVDRGRFKPYDALAGEFQRVLGTTPASLAAASDTFGKAEPRWYDEPAVGGVVLQTGFKIAFDGCLTFTAPPSPTSPRRRPPRPRATQVRGDGAQVLEPHGLAATRSPRAPTSRSRARRRSPTLAASGRTRARPSSTLRRLRDLLI